jgi:hypothetical protein
VPQLGGLVALAPSADDDVSQLLLGVRHSGEVAEMLVIESGTVFLQLLRRVSEEIGQPSQLTSVCHDGDFPKWQRLFEVVLAEGIAQKTEVVCIERHDVDY